MKKQKKTITDYDESETTQFIKTSKNLTLADLGLKLPPQPPTQVISIRLPTPILNQLRSMASQDDIPYQALIKGILADYTRKYS